MPARRTSTCTSSRRARRSRRRSTPAPDEPLLHLLREVLKLLDVQFSDVIAAGIQRSKLRVDLQHADQLLAGAADDRSAASADRSAAAGDRAAAAGDRDSARTARRSAATYRAADEPGIQEN